MDADLWQKIKCRYIVIPRNPLEMQTESTSISTRVTISLTVWSAFKDTKRYGGKQQEPCRPLSQYVDNNILNKKKWKSVEISHYVDNCEQYQLPLDCLCVPKNHQMQISETDHVGGVDVLKLMVQN